MSQSIRRWLFGAAVVLAVLSVAQVGQAHFLWVKIIESDGKPHAYLFFGENAMDEAYHMPESLAKSKVWQRSQREKRVEVPVKEWEGEDRIGLAAPLTADTASVLEASEQYGVYGTAKLSYCAKHISAKTIDELNSAGRSKQLKLEIIPRVKGNELQLTVLWDGKPLADSEVSMAVGESEPSSKKTDAHGRVAFEPEGEGIVGVLANHMQDGVSGKLGEKSFDHELHYASLTLQWPITGTPGSDATSAAAARNVLPALPEPVSSFGAVVLGDWLYVYGGHIGTEHDHSAANLSQHFRRIRLDGKGAWEDLPMQTRLQGLPLVAHGGKVYRVGGLDARNKTTDDKVDLHSTAEFAEFDPAKSKWTALAPLPAPRSSHNAAVIGDKLYVVGGWQLEGKSPGTWQPATLAYDFTQPQAGWQEVPKLPHKRRALAAAHWNGKLAVLGGMDEKSDISMRFDLFDPATGKWESGPDLPGAGMAGFGVSAWNLDSQLYMSGVRGIVYRLNDAGSAWEEAAKLATPRFFHQLVPAAGGGLLAIGGASREGHLADIEWIDVHTKPAATEARAADSGRTTREYPAKSRRSPGAES